MIFKPSARNARVTLEVAPLAPPRIGFARAL